MASPRGAELGDFLRTRRARVNPAQAGLPDTPRRRVVGLRREELAHLAGVSANYYARLEQGTQETASPAVLDAVAAALQLSTEERSHLYDLAYVVDRQAVQPGSGGTAPALPSTVRSMFNALGTTPAFAFDGFADVVAVNRAARFLFADFDAMPASDRNMTVWMLTDPRARTLYGSAWEEVATTMIGALRREAGRQPGNSRVAGLVRRLSDDSALFRNAWRRHDIGTCTRMINRLYHPAGTLEFVSDIVTADSDKGIMFALLIPLNPTGFAALLDHHTRPESD
jgi:transcriptional regulator with XRE-family HTH domain